MQKANLDLNFDLPTIRCIFACAYYEYPSACKTKSGRLVVMAFCVFVYFLKHKGNTDKHTVASLLA